MPELKEKIERIKPFYRGPSGAMLPRGLLRYAYAGLASFYAPVALALAAVAHLYLSTWFARGISAEEAGASSLAVRALGLLDPGSSPVFIAVLIALMASLIACGASRCKPAFSKRRPPPAFEPTHGIMLTQDASSAFTQVRHTLKEKLGFRVASTETDWIVMEKGLRPEATAWLMHAGLVIAAAGMLLTLALHSSGTLTLVGGEEGAIDGADFTIRIERMRAEYAGAVALDHPVDAKSRVAVGLGWLSPAYVKKSGSLVPLDLRTDITIASGGETLKEGAVSVGSPLRHGLFSFHQSGYSQNLAIRVDDNPILLEARNNEEVFVPGLSYPLVFEGLGGGTIRRPGGSVEPIQTVTLVKRRLPSGGIEELGNLSPGQSMRLGDRRITLAGVEEAGVLMFSRDPGSPVFFAGCALALASLLLRTFLPFYSAAYHLSQSGGIVRLDMHVASTGVFSSPDGAFKKAAGLLTRDDILPEPLAPES